MLERSREWFYKNDKNIRFSAAVFASVALYVYLASHPTTEQTQFKGYLPIPTPRPILGFPPIPLNPRLEVLALCQPPGKYGEKVLPPHIRFIVKAENINAGPSKMWIVIKNQQTGIEMITTYMTNKGLINIEGTYEGFFGSIDNAKQHIIKTGNPYSVQIRGEIIANGFPATEKIIVEENIITPSCPK